MGVLGITPHERETTPWMEEVENVWKREACPWGTRSREWEYKS